MAVSRAEYMRKRFSGSQALLHRREQRIVRDYLEMLGVRPRNTLDLPSGHGRFTHLLRAVTDERLVCADIRQSRLDALVNAEQRNGTPIETRVVDIFAGIDLPDAGFDLVFNFRFFHHVPEPARREHVIAELARLSARYIIVSYYDTVGVHALQKRLWQRKGHKPRLPMVPRREFLREFENRGYRTIDDRSVMAGIHAHRIALLERRQSHPA